MRRAAGGLVAFLLSLAGSAAADCSLTPMAELPVTMTNSDPLVAVKINGLATYLTVDSGASLNTLSRAKAQEFGLDVVSTVNGTIMTGVGGSEWAMATTIRQFTFAGSTFRNIPFLVAPGEYGTDVAGLLGRNFLNMGDDEFDLAHGMVRVFRPHDCGKDVLAYWGGA